MRSLDPGLASPLASALRVEGHELRSLDSGWEAAACAPDAHAAPAEIDGLDWLPAAVPGTAAAALRDAGRWRPGEPVDLDAEDWWFRTTFATALAEPGEELALRFDGIATCAEVFLNGELVLEGASMFSAYSVAADLLRPGGNELAIRCRALGPLLRQRRKPRPRWRTRLADGNLRFFRTMLLGRAPGFAPGPAAVGPWRPVWLQRRRALAVEFARLRTSLDGADGLLTVAVGMRGLGGMELRAAALELSGPSGEHRVALDLEPGADCTRASGELAVPEAARWWPHTHGEPALHEVRLAVETSAGEIGVSAGRVGFRELVPGPGPGHEVEADGLDLHVNGTRVFARGAVWTPPDSVGLAADREQLRQALERVRDAGMNMLRIPGTGAYESPAFHDLCDELGLLVWQDLMFANFDYPVSDQAFRATVAAEAEAVLGELGGRPSLAVVCGNSEVEQQVAMMGLDPELGRGELFGDLLPGLVDAAGLDAVWVPSAPCGGTLPFRPDSGVANYYGVGGYRRGLDDVRHAGVRFAAECLAFANVPDEAGLEELLPGSAEDAVVHLPRWKAGVPRDVGAGWDFDDVRDHYLEQLFGVDAGALRRYDPERYLELSRAVSGEAMAMVFAEWRRAASPCGGGLVLWMQDLAPGAGWGLLDSGGRPKLAYHLLRRALAPLAVWTTAEGLGGVGVHVANDGPEPFLGRLRLALYRDREQRVGEEESELSLPAHGAFTADLEARLGRFVDASWSYRFGPPAQDLIVASLERGSADDREVVSRAFHFPLGPPLDQESRESLGLEASATREGGDVVLELRAERLVYGLRVDAGGLVPDEDGFCLEPGRAHRLRIRGALGTQVPAAISLRALNMRGRAAVALSG